MKPVLLCNITKYNLREVEALINQKNLFAATAVVDAEAFTDELERFLNRYAINVIIPLTGTDSGHGSLSDVETRNPGLEVRINSWPRHKLAILFNTDSVTATEDLTDRTGALLALALSFPDNRVLALRGASQHDAYFPLRDRVWQYGQLPEDPIEAPNIEFETSMTNRFNILDYQFMKEIGLIGGTFHV